MQRLCCRRRQPCGNRFGGWWPDEPPRRPLDRPRHGRFAAGAARASGDKKEGKADVGQYVDLQPVGLPIVFNRQLVNYVFVYVRINLTSGANVSKLREKEPYFRDALVRLGHRTPFTLPTDLSKIDAPRLTAALNAEVARIAGPARCCRSWSPPRRRGGGSATPRA
jgi:hypothetical protein